MTYIAGVDIGNSTTEVCIGEVGGAQVHFLSSASCKTTGTKGTIANVHGIRAALKEAMGKIGMETEALSLIRLNEAAPVIGDTAMETLTETIITDSSMIGHNPSTPAGAGQAVGKTLDFERIREGVPGTPYIVFAKAAASYEEIAEVINRERKRLTITGVILQADEAVLVENRLEEKVPIIDEVAGIQKLPDAFQPVRDCNAARTGCRADADDHADCEKSDRKAKCGRFKNTGRQYPGESSSRRKNLSPCRSGRSC